MHRWLAPLWVVILVACSPAGPPSAEEVAAVDPVFASGQVVYLTEEGARPRQLVAVVDREVVFVNASEAVQEVTFVGDREGSGPLEPGERFAITPERPVSIGYRASADPDEVAAIQVEREEPADRG